MSRFEGPYLEVGSKDYGNTQDIKALFPETERYIGIDMEEGSRVDIVLDLRLLLQFIQVLFVGFHFYVLYVVIDFTILKRLQ